MKIAFATDNGITFVERHFGDAKHYLIYEINEQKISFVRKIDNSLEAEEMHADPKKAKGISSLLFQEDVAVVVSKIFGPNIARIRKKFVCIVSKEKDIVKSIDNIQGNYNAILSEWKNGEERKHLIL